MNRPVRRALLLCLFAAALPLSASAEPMATPGQFAVNASGAATYTIPIQMPPMPGGLVPQLALTYNSQAGNGYAGVGWSISGLSAITRCPATQAQDGVSRGLTYDGRDALCLDGQRLIAVSGAYGMNNTEYRTERDTFAKIVSYTSNGVAPQTFKVWTRSGRVQEYGTTSNSQQGVTPYYRAWWMTSMSDRFSNTLQYVYNGDGTLNSINTYRSDTGITTKFLSVTFGGFPGTRSDAYSLYAHGEQIQQRNLLRVITTYSKSGVAYKTYTFGYQDFKDATSPVSRLNSIKECSSNGVTTSCFPVTVVTYQDNPNNTATFGATFQSDVLDWGQDTGRAWVDIDGDGRADFCRVTGATGANRLACTVSIGSGFGATITSDMIDPGLAADRKWIDVNNDGKPDYCRITGSTGAYRLACTLATATGFGATITSDVLDIGLDGTRGWIDVNRDGRADFCRVVQDAASNTYLNKCAFATATGFADNGISSSASAPSNLGTLASAQDKTWAYVIDGPDGEGSVNRCELQLDTTVGKIVMCRLLGTNQGSNNSASATADWGDVAGRAWIPVGADGKTGFCRISNGVPTCIRSNGLPNGQAFKTGITSASNVDVGIPMGRRWADVNGDRRADYCRITGTAGAYSMACTLSTENDTLGPTVTSPVLDVGVTDTQDWADVNGDGIKDFCRLTGTANLADSRIACTPLLMNYPGATAIDNGAGKTIAIAYKPLTDSSVYTKDNTATDPQRDLQIPLYVVASSAAADGIGGTITTNYTYGGLKLDTTGRGLLGFRWMDAVRADTGLTAHVEYRQDWPYTGLAATSMTKLPGSGNNGVLSQSANTYGCTDPASGTACTVAIGHRYFAYLSQSTSTSWDADGTALPTITQTAQYDAWGNPVQTTASSSDGYATTTTSTVSNDVANWLLGQVTRTTVTRTTP
jgi:hypothetical protein